MSTYIIPLNKPVPPTGCYFQVGIAQSNEIRLCCNCKSVIEPPNNFSYILFVSQKNNIIENFMCLTCGKK